MYDYEAGVIRRLMGVPAVRIIYKHHAERVRMIERGITDNDVRTVLKRCRVTEVRPDDRGDAWSAEGTDCDGRRLRVVVSVREDVVLIIVITTIDLDSKG